MARLDNYYKPDELKVGSLVRWWGADVTDNDQDVDDIGIVTEKESRGVRIWGSVCERYNFFEWTDIEESMWQDQLVIVVA